MQPANLFKSICNPVLNVYTVVIFTKNGGWFVEDRQVLHTWLSIPNPKHECQRMIRMPILHPQDDIPRNSTIFVLKIAQHVLARIPETPMDTDKGGFGKGTNPRVKLCIMRMTLLTRRLVQFGTRFAQKGYFMNNMFVFGQNLFPSLL